MQRVADVEVCRRCSSFGLLTGPAGRHGALLVLKVTWLRHRNEHLSRRYIYLRRAVEQTAAKHCRGRANRRHLNAAFLNTAPRLRTAHACSPLRCLPPFRAAPAPRLLPATAPTCPFCLYRLAADHLAFVFLSTCRSAMRIISAAALISLNAYIIPRRGAISRLGCSKHVKHRQAGGVNTARRLAAFTRFSTALSISVACARARQTPNAIALYHNITWFGEQEHPLPSRLPLPRHRSPSFSPHLTHRERSRLPAGTQHCVS